MNKRFFNVIKGVIGSRFGYKIPLRVMHFVTFRCNLACKYCGIWSTKIKEMTTEEAKKAIKEFADAGTFHWVFTGGEPLLRRDIGELIDYLKDFGVATTLTTNGTLLHQNLSKIKNVDYLVVSLDGPEKINDFVRGKGVYKKVVNNVKLAKNNGFEIVLNATLSLANIKNNFYGIKEIINLAEKLGTRLNFSVIYLDSFNQKSDYNRNRIFEVYPTRLDIIQALKVIKEEKKKRKNFIMFSNDNINQLMLMKKWKTCYAGKLFCDLFPDGTVVPCLFKPYLGINGLKEGFYKAFIKLPENKDCICPSTCYNELNTTFSLKLKAVYENFRKYLFLVK